MRHLTECITNQYIMLKDLLRAGFRVRAGSVFHLSPTFPLAYLLSVEMALPISNLGIALISLGVVFLLLTTIMVCARLWSRYLKKAKYGLDDWISLAALPCFYGQGSILKLQNEAIALTFSVALHFYGVIAGGLDLPSSLVSTQTELALYRSLTFVQLPYSLSLIFVRLSICLLFNRTFTQRWVRICSTYIVSRKTFDRLVGSCGCAPHLVLTKILVTSVHPYCPNNDMGNSQHNSSPYCLRITVIWMDGQVVRSGCSKLYLYGDRSI